MLLRVRAEVLPVRGGSLPGWAKGGRRLEPKGPPGLTRSLVWPISSAREKADGRPSDYAFKRLHALARQGDASASAASRTPRYGPAVQRAQARNMFAQNVDVAQDGGLEFRDPLVMHFLLKSSVFWQPRLLRVAKNVLTLRSLRGKRNGFWKPQGATGPKIKVRGYAPICLVVGQDKLYRITTSPL